MTPPSNLREVAKRAGVSLSTASQALNNRPNVAQETRERVLEAAVALGYQQQIRLSSPMTNKLAVVGVLIKRTTDSPLINPFYSHVLAGVERECQRQNLSLMYANIAVDSRNCPLSMPSMLTDSRVDGVLVVGATLEERVDEIAQKPIVLVDAYSEQQQFDSVVSDNINGAYTAVSYLIQQGHTRIGLIGSIADGYPSIRERRKGYMRALKHHGIQDCYIEDGLLSRETAYEDTIRMLRRFPEITAIFACNDEVAMGVLKAAQDLELSVPDDLSLIGFDDIDFAQEIVPALTTVHVDKILMGVMGVRQLRDRAENHARTTMTVTVNTQLIVRDSVRRIP